MKTYTTEQIAKAVKKAGHTPENVLKHLELSITERLQTWQDAFTETGTPIELPFDLDTTDPIQKSVNAHYILCVITKALNEGWEIDITNKDQVVWVNWHDFRKFFVGGYSHYGSNAGFGFSHSYSPANASTTTGSRLCFETEAKADFCRIKFVDLWMDYKIPEYIRK